MSVLHRTTAKCDQRALSPAAAPRTMTATPYHNYLLALAAEQTQFDATKCLTVPIDPPTFAHEMFRFFDYTMRRKREGSPIITRLGMERALDAMFSLPELTPLLDAPDNHQNNFTTTYLHQTCPLFQSYWTHIIVPAWNQHADIRRACRATSDAAATTAATATATA